MDLKINATEGKISLDHLQRTLIHEHVLAGLPGWDLDRRSPPFKKAEVMAEAIDKLQELKAYGCNTIVDPCPIDIGRDVEFLAEASQKSGVTIIAATGVYTEAEGIVPTFRNMSLEEVVELYVNEIEEGVGSTGIKAGVLKIATGEGKVTDYERKMITAAARASKITGVPIISHTHYATLGHDQIDIVTGEGVASNQLVVGHTGDRDDPEYQQSLCDRGAFIGLDRFGVEWTLPDDIRMKILVGLVKKGYRENLLISQDNIIHIHGHAGIELRKIWPWGMDHLFKDLMPKLYDQGMTDEDFEIILEKNPKRLFANAAMAKEGHTGACGHAGHTHSH